MDKVKLNERNMFEGQLAKDIAILIVEDNVDMQEYLSILLDDYSLHIKDNGQEALDWLLTSKDSKNVNLILSDIMMPIMDGIELLHKVKSDEYLRMLPFILLTAKADIDTKLSAIRFGIDDYIVKPFNEDELKARIFSLLYNYFQRRKYNKYHDHQAQNTSNKNDVKSADFIWLEGVEKIVKEHLSDERLNIEFLASKLYLSSRQLQRKLKEITGLSANRYIQQYRISTARKLLQKGTYKTVKEVCFAIGYNDTKYFSKLFRKMYGVIPSSYT